MVANGTLSDLRTRLVGMRVGSIRVTNAKVEPQFDRDGDEYVEVTLVLSDPPRGQESWSLDDAFALRQNVRRIAADELGIADYVSVVFAASVDLDVPGEDEDEGGSEAENRT